MFILCLSSLHRYVPGKCILTGTEHQQKTILLFVDLRETVQSIHIFVVCFRCIDGSAPKNTSAVVFAGIRIFRSRVAPV